MSDTLWHDRLTDLADDEDATSFLVDDDLVRGRERLRRRRVGEVGAAGLVLAVLAGGALLTGGGGPHAEPPPAATVAPVPSPAEPETPEPSAVESAIAPTPSESGTATMPKRYAWIRNILERSDGPRAPFPRWRNRLYATTASVLDPSGGHLDYANRGWTGGWDEEGISLGIKMGWSEPGRTGEGMVHVEISSQHGSDDERCQLTSGLECPQTVRIGGRTAHLGVDKDSYVVALRQADGDQVVVFIDKKFGNESPRGVDQFGFTRDDVYRLVQDPRLDLPRR
jgi:hypothetical protein